MNAIASILARAKAACAPVERITLTRRVRPVDASCAAGAVIDELDGWVFWIGDDGFDHLSRPDYLEPEN